MAARARAAGWDLPGDVLPVEPPAPGDPAKPLFACRKWSAPRGLLEDVPEVRACARACIYR
jgi:hypothetical protein